MKDRFEYLENGIAEGFIEERFNETLEEFLYYDTREDEWLDNSGQVVVIEESERFRSIPTNDDDF